MTAANTKAKTAPATKSNTTPVAVKAGPSVPPTEPKQATAPAPAKPAPVKASAPADAAAKIKLLCEKNPHGETTKDFQKWKLVAANLTVGAALKAGIDRSYLSYAARRKLLEIVR